MLVHQCIWGHGSMGLDCSQELFPYVYVTSGVMTSVQKDWEGMGHIKGDQCVVIKWGILLQSPHQWSSILADYLCPLLCQISHLC